uniref:Serine carboxypeptidase n=1 Tax=Rhipicephalus appendiculatus TaxID=34631 RepID=A0A131YF95_RHIAP
MKTTLSWRVMLLLGGLKCTLSQQADSQRSEDPNTSDSTLPKKEEPLYLTPYIQEKKYDQAKVASKVHLFEQLVNSTAYSGFITVNSTYNSSLFFLFVVAEGNKSDAPVLLWTMGGPGLSALFGQFLENGPIACPSDGISTNFSIRANTLQKNMSIIYLDAPIGAGYSFTDDPRGYSKSLEEITDDIMKFLEQFFELFWEYKNKNFYAAGESYAARYSVSIAHRMINHANQKLPSLKGVIGGNGFLGPILDIAESSEFMYQLSMVNRNGCDAFSDQFNRMRNEQNVTIIPYMLSRTMFIGNPPTLFQNVTLYNDYLSPLYTERLLSMQVCFGLINSSAVRSALHIGRTLTFQYNNELMLYSLAADYITNINDTVAKVLESTSVLFYTGQLDPLFPSVNQRSYLSKLQWRDSAKYNAAQRVTWKPPTWQPVDGFAGYLKQTETLTDAVIVGMSHYGAIEKPNEAYFLMMEFITNTSTSKNEPSQQ